MAASQSKRGLDKTSEGREKKKEFSLKKTGKKKTRKRNEEWLRKRRRGRMRCQAFAELSVWNRQTKKSAKPTTLFGFAPCMGLDQGVLVFPGMSLVPLVPWLVPLVSRKDSSERNSHTELPQWLVVPGTERLKCFWSRPDQSLKELIDARLPARHASGAVARFILSSRHITLAAICELARFD